MSRVGVKELKNRLTEFLRRTQKGEEIIVTDRGRPIALIQPIESAKQFESLEARLAALSVQGLVELPSQPRLKKVLRARIKGRALSKIILEDRD